MSFSTTRITGAKETLVVSIPAEEDFAASANATPETNVSAFATSKFYKATIDALNNPGEDVTLRLYDLATAPAVGTTPAHIWLKGTRGEETNYDYPIGIKFTAGIGVAVVQGAGGTGGAVNPTGIVKVKISVTDS